MKTAFLLDCRFGELPTIVATLTLGAATDILEEMAPDVCQTQTLDGAVVGQLTIDRVMLNRWTPSAWDYDPAAFAQARAAMWNIEQTQQAEPYLKIEISQ